MSDILENLLPPAEPEDKGKKEIPKELDSESKRKILERWNDPNKPPPGIKELTEMIFGAGVDGRDKRAQLIKKYCGSLGFKPKSSFEYVPADKPELNESQKQYIVNNCSTMTAVEISRELFNNPSLTNLDNKTRVVNEYIKTLSNAVLYSDPSSVPAGDYRAPKTPPEALNRINRYDHTNLKLDKLTPKQQKDISALINHLHSLRFIQKVSTYQSQMDRDLFESVYMRAVWTKASEITNEESDLFVIIASEAVIESNIEKRIETLQKILDDTVKDDGGDEKKRISMSLVEGINTLTEERHKCITRQKSLLSDVSGKRSERIKNKVAENASLITLIEFWKNHETRQQMLQLAELRKRAVKDEIERLETMDDLKFQIWGISKEEILNS